MCTGLEIAALAAATGLSAGGAAKNRSEDEKAQRRTVDANNRIVQETLAKNDPLAAESRGFFDTALGQFAPGTFAASQGALTDGRTDTITSSLQGADPDAVPIFDSSPDVVKSEIAKRMLEASQFSTDRAKAIGKVGGFGDAVFRGNLGNEDARRNIATNNNLIQGNNSILTTLQDLENVASFKPKSPLGDIMIGTGQLLGSAAGAGFGPSTPAALPARTSSSVPQVIRS